MKLETVEIYSHTSNYAVLKLNGRSFPGSLIQGDSLSVLVSEIAEAKTAIEVGENEEAKEILNHVLEGLIERLNIYTEVLKAHNIVLPFTKNSLPRQSNGWFLSCIFAIPLRSILWKKCNLKTTVYRNVKRDECGK